MKKLLLITVGFLGLSSLALGDAIGPPAGAPIQNNPNLQPGTFNLSSATIQNVHVTTVTFSDGTFQITASSGSGGGGLNVGGTPQINYEVTWNGSSAVWASEGASFIYSIATFVDTQPALIEINTGVWQSTGSLSFTATYNNGPSTYSYVSYSGWSSTLTMTNSFLGPTTSQALVNFPSVGGTAIFTLHAGGNAGNDTKSITHTFNNDVYYGTTTISNEVYTSTDITQGLGNNALTNVIPRTFTVTPGAGQYIVYAFPTRLGTASFTVNGFSGGFRAPIIVSVTNASGYVENFKVYRSQNSNLGSTTVVVTTP